MITPTNMGKAPGEEREENPEMRIERTNTVTLNISNRNRNSVSPGF